MKGYCKYFPTEPATWHCERCDVYMSDRIVAARASSGSKMSSICPLCTSDLTFLGNAHLAAPFWQRLPQFYLYPLQKVPLLLALVSTLPMLLGKGDPTIVLQLIVTVLITKYAYVVLEDSANGNMRAPELERIAEGGGLTLVVQQYAVLFAAGAAVVGVLLWTHSTFWTVLVSAVVLLALPASIIVLAMEKTLTAALNINTLFDVITRIGWAYAVLWVFLLFSILSYLTVSVSFYNEVPFPVWGVLTTALGNYFYFWMFHLMGYVIFQFQTELGFAAELKGDKRIQRKRTRLALDPMLARMDVLVKEGRYSQLIEFFRRELKQNSDNLLLHENFDKLLKAMQLNDERTRHGLEYVHSLVQLGDAVRGLQLFRDLKELDDELRPNSDKTAFSLAEKSYERGDYKLAVNLLNNFHQNYFESEWTPEAYFLLSKVLMEGFNKKKEAFQFASFVEANYPGYTKLTEVAQWKRALLAG